MSLIFNKIYTSLETSAQCLYSLLSAAPTLNSQTMSPKAVHDRQDTDLYCPFLPSY